MLGLPGPLANAPHCVHALTPANAIDKATGFNTQLPWLLKRLVDAAAASTLSAAMWNSLESSFPFHCLRSSAQQHTRTTADALLTTCLPGQLSATARMNT